MLKQVQHDRYLVLALQDENNSKAKIVEEA
jgi:hypothetical protein